MIRRRVGDEFWLITQHEHARLAAELAGHFGNDRFARPQPLERAITAAAHHDDGWQAIDDCLTLTAAGLPLDIFESPQSVAHLAWLKSARRATQIDPYVGLLVTLHQFHLSASTVPQNAQRAFDVKQMREQFEINKFQHSVIEHLESLRGRLGMATDRPLRLGLADGWTNAMEDLLRFNFRLLQTVDSLSLAVCCTRPPTLRIGPLHERPGSGEISLTIDRLDAARVRVTPWPFVAATIEPQIAYRAVPARNYADSDDLREAFLAVEEKILHIKLSAG